MKLKLLLFSVLFSVMGWGQVTIFSENMYNGTGGTTGDAIATHESNNRFNEDALTYSGTGDMRTTTTSTGYAGASGTWNAFITSVAGRDFIISDINTSAYTSLVLTFGEYKSAVSTASLLIVEVSSDGVTYTPLTYTRSDGAVWALISPTGTIPSTPNLRIRFRNPSTVHQFRIDDIILTGILASSNTITTNNPLEVSPFCVSASAGASVSVPFTSVGTFNAGNVYTAQLSNASGVFPGTPIGTLGASGVDPSGTITATIPANTPTGTGYRIRVVSSNPTVTGSTTAAFTINLANNSIAPVATQNIATAANGAITVYVLKAQSISIGLFCI